MSVRRIIVDTMNPQAHALDEAAQVIRNGGVVAFPTDTLYGLAADPFNADAVGKVFRAKDRVAALALPLVAADLAQAVRDIGSLPAAGHRLAERFWPGPLTLVVTAPPRMALGVTGRSGTVGVRVPAHAVARAFCRTCDSPLTATSANISGSPPSADADEVARQLGGRVDAILDCGPTPGGQPSTIVDVTGAAPRLVRPGAIAWDVIEAYLRGGA